MHWCTSFVGELEQLLVVRLSGLWVHRHRLIDSISYTLRVPWVDDNTSVQALRGTANSEMIITPRRYSCDAMNPETTS